MTVGNASPMSVEPAVLGVGVVLGLGFGYGSGLGFGLDFGPRLGWRCTGVG